jgi:hypothetical protein
MGLDVHKTLANKLLPDPNDLVVLAIIHGAVHSG